MSRKFSMAFSSAGGQRRSLRRKARSLYLGSSTRDHSPSASASCPSAQRAAVNAARTSGKEGYLRDAVVRIVSRGQSGHPPRSARGEPGAAERLCGVPAEEGPHLSDRLGPLAQLEHRLRPAQDHARGNGL